MCRALVTLLYLWCAVLGDSRKFRLILTILVIRHAALYTPLNTGIPELYFCITADDVSQVTRRVTTLATRNNVEFPARYNLWVFPIYGMPVDVYNLIEIPVDRFFYLFSGTP